MQNPSIRICFIFNPAANRNRSLQHIDWLRREASTLWENYEIAIAKEGESLAELARKKSNLFDVIVACGGDGTVSQIVNGLAKSDTVLGLLPIGSGNDFVKSLSLHRSLSECLKIIHQNIIAEIDLIQIDGDRKGWCANTIGIGVDGWANYHAHQATWLKGKISYYYGALKAILKFRGCQMDIQSIEYTNIDEYVMATVCNGKWEGGNFLVAPNADLRDGKLDLLTIKKVPLLLLLCYLLRFRWGPADWMKGIKTFRSEKIEISTSVPVAVHSDGEHLGSDIRHLKLTVERNALKVLVPKDY
ncbi:MAG: YegS/Rv2252/BmrU family lipid kinase [Balneolaceae bacterium]|nr:YegS/Rv2252/BmrU family lipid kinase [Balneolaceae bacterium]MDR9409678.1 YegS/Rv2252/BmrU family lipid kinase [Balneolaceae bacterium]